MGDGRRCGACASKEKLEDRMNAAPIAAHDVARADSNETALGSVDDRLTILLS
ncbi:hypothetical protein ACWEQN_36710 [Streptomyces sp. NPDC004129]